MNIPELIHQVAAGSSDAVAELWIRFTPLLSKYAHKLQYEDAYSDLSLAFLILIGKIARNPDLKEEKVIVSYIKTAMKNTYYKLYKEAVAYRCHHYNLDTDTETYSRMLEINHSESDDFALIELEDALSKLSDMERHVICAIFQDGISSVDLAQQYGCSRQSIAQAKRRGLQKLRKLLR